MDTYNKSIFASNKKMAAAAAIQRAWDSLPSPTLLNIFTKSSITDRVHNLPLVCRSWAQASHHPHFWASMIADSYYSSSSAADDAFVKDYYPYDVAFVDPFEGRRSSNLHRGVHRLHELIQRADGGEAVTSLYFFPFIEVQVDVDQSSNEDALLSLIANHCPNLKHLSFHGSYGASHEAIMKLIRSCRKLELVDFSNSPYFNPSILAEMGSCCVNLRGLRRNGYTETSVGCATLSAAFPNLRLLNLSNTPIVDRDLLTIVAGCRGLTYLDVTNCERLVYYMHIIKTASVRIAKILFD